jgi:prenyl protein peptidase
MWLYLSGGWSLLLAFLISFSFVLSLYLLCPSPVLLDRDLPFVIRRRILATGGVTLATLPLLWLLRVPAAHVASALGSGPPLLAWLGLPAASPLSYLCALALPLALTAALFLGPLLVAALTAWREVEGEGEAAVDVIRPSLSSLLSSLHSLHLSLWSPSDRWKSLRNLVAAPLAEELLFRGSVLALLASGGFSFAQCILLSPLLFGLAHLHHLVHLVRARGLSLASGAMLVGFQLAYTTVFGIFAAFLCLRTGHLVAAIASHAFCNLLGFPSLSFLARGHFLYARRLPILAVFAAGIAIFSLSMWPLTEPRLYAQEGEQPWLESYIQLLAKGEIQSQLAPAAAAATAAAGAASS